MRRTHCSLFWGNWWPWHSTKKTFDRNNSLFIYMEKPHQKQSSLTLGSHMKIILSHYVEIFWLILYVYIHFPHLFILMHNVFPYITYTLIWHSSSSVMHTYSVWLIFFFKRLLRFSYNVILYVTYLDCICFHKTH